MIREFTENSGETQTHEDSKIFLRHITYNHEEIVQAIVKDFPKKEKREDFSWFR
jgi:hypothetical protein